VIVVAAECRDGFPDHGSYRELLASGSTMPDVLARMADAPATIADQWQVQIQGRVQAQARVVMHTAYLSDTEVAEAHLTQTHDIDETVAAALAAAGPDSRLCVLPEGPQTVPYVTSERSTAHGPAPHG
jgi:lactate racemase